MSSDGFGMSALKQLNGSYVQVGTVFTYERDMAPPPLVEYRISSGFGHSINQHGISGTLTGTGEVVVEKSDTVIYPPIYTEFISFYAVPRLRRFSSNPIHRRVQSNSSVLDRIPMTRVTGVESR